jgi:hypothetical protein
MTQHTLNKSDLSQFTGSEQWYRRGINRKVLFTDGAKHVADAVAATLSCEDGNYKTVYTKEINQRPEEVQRWTAKRRATLVISLLKGETTAAEAARRHGLKLAEVEGFAPRSKTSSARPNASEDAK